MVLIFLSRLKIFFIAIEKVLYRGRKKVCIGDRFFPASENHEIGLSENIICFGQKVARFLYFAVRTEK